VRRHEVGLAIATVGLVAAVVGATLAGFGAHQPAVRGSSPTPAAPSPSINAVRFGPDSACLHAVGVAGEVVRSARRMVRPGKTAQLLSACHERESVRAGSDGRIVFCINAIRYAQEFAELAVSVTRAPRGTAYRSAVLDHLRMVGQQFRYMKTSCEEVPFALGDEVPFA
jgi:hypothetical protein